MTSMITLALSLRGTAAMFVGSTTDVAQMVPLPVCQP